MTSHHSWILYVYVTFTTVVGVAGFVWVYRKLRRLENVLTVSLNEVDNFITRTAHQAYYENMENMTLDRDMEIAKHEFTIDWENPFEQGTFGEVFKGQLNNGVDVIAKTVRQNSDISIRRQKRALVKEIKVLRHIGAHENIVKLVGYNSSNAQNDELYMFLEYCPLGSLQQFLKEEKYTSYENIPLLDAKENAIQEATSGISHNDLLLWSMQITNAMMFLEEKKVVHGDVAFRNILLLRRDCAKLSDFGAAGKLFKDTQYFKKNKEPLPWRWMALESLKHLTFSHQSDVWSLGITIWEIYSMGEVPYPKLSWTENFVSGLEHHFRLMKPPIASNKLYDILLDCWKAVPEARPTFRNIYLRLEDCKQLNI